MTQKPKQTVGDLNSAAADSAAGMLAGLQPLAAPLWAASVPPPLPAASAASNLHLDYAGFNYVADVDGSYASANSLSTMIAQTASNAVALTDDYGIDAATSKVYGDYNTAGTTGNTETLADMTAAIEAAEKDGLSVLVRPLVDFTADASTAILTGSDGNVYYDTEWRAYYNPTSISSFFASYTTDVVAEAKAAQAAGAQLFDIGTELDQLAGSAYLSYWTTLISDVRAVFSGKLTYSAIDDTDLSPWQYGGTNLPAGTGNFATQISFWSQLDYVGIDEYAAISDVDEAGGGADPTLAQLIAGWEDTPTDPTTLAMTGGLSLIKYYEGLAATIGKPLLFTEIGYNSAPDAAYQPFYTSSATYDPALQANLYQAFVTAWKAQGNTSLQGVYIWNWEPDPTTVGAGEGPNWTPQDNTGALQVVDAAYTAATACYAAGTLIATEDGDCPVEQLAVGQRVMLARSGASAPVVWLGHRHVDLRRHPRPADVRPVRVQAGAFGACLPRRDLLLSPDHAVFAEGALIPVRHLINGASIVQEPADAITYWHVELARHAVILAEGLPCESYLDTGNRAAFTNGGPARHLHPDFALRIWRAAGCAPLLLHGPRLAAMQRRLLDRAAALGHAVTGDAGVRVMAGGTLCAAACDGARWHAKLPPGTRRVHLQSRIWTPAHMHPGSTDPRPLGVAIARLWLDGTPVALDSAALTAGWHAPEPGWRWTGGNAALSVHGARELAFEVAITGSYWHRPAARRSARAALAAAPEGAMRLDSLVG